ncbi:MAG: hypothetical protein U0792_01835 [Gemmataceae bacterium]
MAVSSDVLDTPADAYQLITTTPGPTGKLPLTDELLRHAPSGDLFGWTQNVGMGWNPALLGGKEFTILSTHGDLRADSFDPARGFALRSPGKSGSWATAGGPAARYIPFARRGRSCDGARRHPRACRGNAAPQRFCFR